MKISLENFGPIKQFEVDLNKDFHLFIGKNSIGKSYAITAIYLIVKTLLEMRGARAHAYGGVYLNVLKSQKTSLLNNEGFLLDFMEDKSVSELNIHDSAFDDIKHLFESSLVTELTNSFLSTFSSFSNLENKYNAKSGGAKIKISTYFSEIELTLRSEKIEISNFEINEKFLLKKAKTNRTVLFSGNENIIYAKIGQSQEEIISKFTEDYASMISINFNATIKMFTDNISTVHYLPASRSGLYQALSAFGQIIAELSRNRSFLSKKIELPGISEPVSDYFLKLSDIRVNKRSFEDKKLNAIAMSIENDILGGRVEFDSLTKQIMFSPEKTNLKLELSSTSSMVSELAPIVSYLRYVLTKPEPLSLRINNVSAANTMKSLVMIEEPEAHLHPEVQIKLTEIFERIVGANTKLIITSHSNYIFNKVNNLIIKSNKSSQTEGFNINNVSSLVFKKTPHGSVAHELHIDELGIDDDNFTDATEILFDEKMDIFSELNKEADE